MKYRLSATTHAAMHPGPEAKDPPLAVYPDNDGEWEFLAVTSCVSPDGTFHFFFFWGSP